MARLSRIYLRLAAQSGRIATAANLCRVTQVPSVIDRQETALP